MSRHSLRGQIAYVGQDVFLFHGSIRDNIAIGKPGASEAEIVAAAKAAHAHDFITGFPAGYDTAGRRTRRAALRRRAPAHRHRPRADQERADHPARRGHRLARFRIRAAGAGRHRPNSAEGRTTIAIAHRLHTIIARRPHHGGRERRVVESGRHDELLRKGGRYAAFYRLQIRSRAARSRAGRDASRSDRKSLCYPKRKAHAAP